MRSQIVAAILGWIVLVALTATVVAVELPETDLEVVVRVAFGLMLLPGIGAAVYSLWEDVMSPVIRMFRSC